MSPFEISPELLEALKKVAGLLESETTLDKTLTAIAELCVATIPGCDSAGVTLRIDGKHTTAAASDAYTLEIDRIQYDSKEGGPCVTALEESTFIQIDAVSEETRWPEFCARAAEHGFRSSISFPLKNGTKGALNVYSKTERAFKEDGIAVGGLMASQATVALHNAQTFLASQHLVVELQEALKSRDLIGQAKGILMEREGITDTAAFEMLRTMSQSTNVKLRDVAQRVVDQAARPGGR